MKTHKILYKLIILILFISLSITSLSLYVHLSKEYTDQVNLLKSELNDIETNRLDVLSDSIWSFDEKTINLFLKSLLNNKKIVYTEYIDESKNIISYGNKKTENIFKKEIQLSKIVDSKEFKLGTLLIIADLNPLYKEIKENAIHTILYEIFKIIIISLLIIFSIKKLLTNYLEKLVVYVDNLSLDNLDLQLEIKNKNKMNEIDMLSNSFNTIRQNLSKEIVKNKEKDNLIYQQSKMAAMGEMIENIAHQWRQPLSVISAASTGVKLKNELKVLKEEEISSSMVHINNSVKHLSHTIDDFKDFFKTDKKKFEFLLNDTFEKTFKLIISQFKTANITIIKNIEDVSFFGFENELIQVLINILNNARDELIKKDNSSERLIIIDVVKKDTLLEIYIKDNAGGIPKDIINEVFEPHFTTKEETNGTGIGLYMSRMIIKEHMNGALEVDNVDFVCNNTPYIGAEFKITLPLSF